MAVKSQKEFFEKAAKIMGIEGPVNFGTRVDREMIPDIIALLSGEGREVDQSLLPARGRPTLMQVASCVKRAKTA